MMTQHFTRKQDAQHLGTFARPAKHFGNMGVVTASSFIEQRKIRALQVGYAVRVDVIGLNETKRELGDPRANLDKKKKNQKCRN